MTTILGSFVGSRRLKFFSFSSIYAIKSSSFFFIARVKIIKGTPQNSKLKAGDYFGHEVIAHQKKYAATVMSLQTITGWKIDREVLTNIISVEQLKI